MVTKYQNIRTEPYWLSRTWVSGKRPYVMPRPYTNWSSRVTNGTPAVWPAYSNFLSWDALPRYQRYAMETRAFEKFRDKVSDFAMLAVNYAERKQAVNSLVTRATGARNQLENLFNRRWKVLAKAVRRNGTNWNKTFLEFHFGWIPLMQDIHTTATLLTKAPPSGYFSAKGSSHVLWQQENGYQRQSQDAFASVMIRGPVWVENPNLHLTSQLGLLNPASIAWELVPFSFVVDWFANINTVLSQFSDFAGVNTSRVSYTTRVQGTIFRTYLPPYPQYPTNFDCFELVRKPGLPLILPTVKPFHGFSVVRGATAIALLLNAANPFDKLFRRKGYY